MNRSGHDGLPDTLNWLYGAQGEMKATFHDDKKGMGAEVMKESWQTLNDFLDWFLVAIDRKGSCPLKATIHTYLITEK